MPTVDDMVPRVREALSVDSSYDTEIIPYGIRRQMVRLLRDYHFPQSVVKKTYTGLAAGASSYTRPAGFKKELLVQFYDTQAQTYGSPMLKREGFVQPYSDGIPRHYWLTGSSIFTDISLDAGNAPTTNLVVWYESMDWAINENWMIEQFEDVLFTLSVFRLAAEKNKKELAEIYGALWVDDRQALAQYLNELEFDNGVYMQREVDDSWRLERYPGPSRRS